MASPDANHYCPPNEHVKANIGSDRVTDADHDSCKHPSHRSSPSRLQSEWHPERWHRRERSLQAALPLNQSHAILGPCPRTPRPEAPRRCHRQRRPRHAHRYRAGRGKGNAKVHGGGRAWPQGGTVRANEQGNRQGWCRRPVEENPLIHLAVKQRHYPIGVVGYFEFA